MTFGDMEVGQSRRFRRKHVVPEIADLTDAEMFDALRDAMKTSPLLEFKTFEVEGTGELGVCKITRTA